MQLCVLLIAFFLNLSFAINHVAVLEIIPNASVAEQITLEEGRHLTDELRRQAVSAVPRQNFSVLTRDNLIALIPPSEEEAECLAEGCAVDIGRAISVEYISQGTIGKFGKRFTILVELYETTSGKLLGSIVMESEDVDGLLLAIRREAKPLFEKIAENVSHSSVAEMPRVAEVPKEAVDFAKQETKIGGINWKAWAVDALGVAALTYGFMQNREISKMNSDYRTALSEGGDYEGALKKLDNANTRRNVGYIAGGILLTGGIAIHIWF